MGLLEFAMVLSVVVALYNIQQIKLILRDKGYTVDAFRGWLKDYRRFKALIPKEPSEKVKTKYNMILNGLHFSLFGTVLFAVLVISR
jgi:hypothetical protein